jgi:hypothetical protein
MSAYIVSPKTMNRVVSTLLSARQFGVHLEGFAGLPLSGVILARDTEQRIAEQLYAMNREAVIQRYPDSHAEGGYSDLPAGYRFAYEIVNRCSGLKAIRCLLYQCTEGTIDETPLYRELQDFAHSLAYAIVADLPEYEKADWG